MKSTTEGHLGQTDEELKRASQGRIEAVLSLLNTGEQQLYVLHVRLLPQARTLRRRFREVDALRLMGFTPRPECPYFPYQCFYAGCYYRELGEAADEATRRRYEEIFDKALDSLAEAIENILAGAWLAEDIGLPLK
jgi:hypothetical protein